MNIEKALAIEGGMNPLELEWLAEKASKCKRVVEVGSYRGRSSRGMADNMIGDSVLFCVDHFKGSEEHKGAYSSGIVLYDDFCANMQDHIKSGRVYVLRYPSVEAAEIIATALNPTNLDMVFIDASHDYDSVMTDIRAWRPLLKPGGLLCGHDHGHPPIERAVREVFGNNYRPVPGGSIWEAL